MDGYLTKPLRSRDLQGVIDVVRTARRPTAPGVPPDAAPARVPEPRRAATSGRPAAAAADARESGLREADLRRRLAELGEPGCAEDDELLAGLLRSFRQRAPTMLASLGAAVRAQDAARVEQLAHALKGAALNIGADGLGAVSAQVEAAARAGTVAGLDTALSAAEAEVGLLAPLVDVLVAALEG